METTFEQEQQRLLNEGFSIARVVAEHREMYTILVNGKTMPAEVTGRLMYSASSRKDFPAVGDWVAVQLYENSHAIIHHILPRRTCISRKTSGREFDEQIIAANVDIVFIIQSLDHNYNLRRLERFLVVAAESGATPVVLLSKADLVNESELNEKVEEVRRHSPGIHVIAYSATTLSHIDEIKRLIGKETTVCFIGSSGVGKSTLINKLIGKDILKTQEVRDEDSKGRHTTTTRQLIPLENGGYVIDTPGIRELGLWNVSTGIEEIFPEISELSRECKFSDCTHTHEPNCAVLDAVAQGTLDKTRYASYIKLKKESEYIAAKTNITKAQERKAKEKQLNKQINQFVKSKFNKRK